MKTGLDTFDYVVVLMLENRSFDNMLGYLYSQENFEGLWGKDYWNPVPYDYPNPITSRISAHPTELSNSPQTDPGEDFQHVNMQLFGNRNGPTDPSQVPSQVPPQVPMKGFVIDYVENFKSLTGKLPTNAQMAEVMGCFSPDAVPVISTLARSFAVFDHWFCDVPTQTIANRSFFHSAQSNGFVNNNNPWETENIAPTIFNRISEKNLTWGVYYYTEYNPKKRLCNASITLLHHLVPLQAFQQTNFFEIGQFLEDVEKGRLPHYSFIEPQLFTPTNSEHPPASVTPGEHLINQIYNAIRTSSYATNTLLAITYDEHGGCFDHVPPPQVVPPFIPPEEGEAYFTFDRLGVRVPMVMISAYIDPETIVRDVYRHTSFIRTLESKWGLDPLNLRDATAPSFEKVFNRTTPRDSGTWPIITPNVISPRDESNDPLNDLQREYLRMFWMVCMRDAPEPDWSRIQTVGDAKRFWNGLQ